MSVMTEQEQWERNRFKGKVVAWAIIGAGFLGIWGADRVLNGEPEEPVKPHVSDFLPSQEDCANNPTLMGC